MATSNFITFSANSSGLLNVNGKVRTSAQVSTTSTRIRTYLDSQSGQERVEINTQFPIGTSKVGKNLHNVNGRLRFTVPASICSERMLMWAQEIEEKGGAGPDLGIIQVSKTDERAGLWNHAIKFAAPVGMTIISAKEVEVPRDGGVVTAVEVSVRLEECPTAIYLGQETMTQHLGSTLPKLAVQAPAAMEQPAHEVAVPQLAAAAATSYNNDTF